MKDFLQQNAEYRRQLDSWFQLALNKIGSRQIFLQLTSYFRFDETDNNQMSASTLSRTIGASAEPPARKEGKYNLYSVLGTLYALSIIDKGKLETFLETYEITPPKGDNWQEIWTKIEGGATQATQHIEHKSESPAATTESNPVPATPTTLTKTNFKLSSNKALLLLLLAGLILFSAVALINSHFSIPMNVMCSEPVPQSDPTFLPDQGFSQFLPNASTPKSSILQAAVRSIGIDQHGVWVGYMPDGNGMDGVSYYDGKRWIHCSGFKLAAGQFVNDFAFLNGKVFVATDGAGIGQLDFTNGWRIYTTNDGLPSNSSYGFMIDRERNLWAATYEGAARFTGNTWNTIFQSKPDGLMSNHLHALSVSQSGDLWFGLLNGGINR